MLTWTSLLIAAAVLAGLYALQRRTLIPEAAAREHLARGALVIDVRSPEEFRAGPVPGAINIPLGALAEQLPVRVKDRSQVLLLHCLSGGRSAVAQHRARALGFTHTFNLGSLGRAQQIVNSTPPRN